jgi:hypothetical protein
VAGFCAGWERAQQRSHAGRRRLTHCSPQEAKWRLRKLCDVNEGATSANNHFYYQWIEPDCVSDARREAPKRGQNSSLGPPGSLSERGCRGFLGGDVFAAGVKLAFSECFGESNPLQNVDKNRHFALQNLNGRPAFKTGFRLRVPPRLTEHCSASTCRVGSFCFK